MSLFSKAAPPDDDAGGLADEAEPAAPATLSVGETIRHLALQASIETCRTTGVSVADSFYIARAARFADFIENGLPGEADGAPENEGGDLDPLDSDT